MINAKAAPRGFVRAGEANYVIGAEDSARIQIWKLWLCLMMPLCHVYSGTGLRVGGAAVAKLALPGWS